MQKQQRSKYVRAKPKRYAPRPLHADDILRIMHAPVDLSWSDTFADLPEDESDAIFRDWRRHWWPRKQKIGREATATELLAALHSATTPSDRAILIEILGWRDNPRIVSELVSYVNDPSPRVRLEAADSIAKVAYDAQKRFGRHSEALMESVTIGPILLSRLVEERRHQQRNIYLPAALGAIDYRPAIPALIESLRDPSENLRNMAAWSLGMLCAEEAIEPLERALAGESDSLAQQAMQMAIDAIMKNRGQHGE